MTKNKAKWSLKLLLDLGMALYIILIPVIIITGGFKTKVLGVPVRAHHLDDPVSILCGLLFLRLLITLEFKNFLLVIFSILLSMGSVEIFLRMWNPPLARPGMVKLHRLDSTLGWGLVPDSNGVGRLGEKYYINNQGQRDIENRPDLIAGTDKRVNKICAIGDSFTFGLGVNAEDSYVFKLEEILNKKKCAATIQNFGVSAYHLWQYTEVLKEKALKEKPDLVLFGIYMDDIVQPVHPNETGEKMINPFKDWKGDTPFSGKMNSIRLVNFIRNINSLFEARYRYKRGVNYLKGIDERKKELGPENPDHLYHRIMYGKYDPEKYILFEKKMKEISEIAQAADVKALAILIPDAAQLFNKDAQAFNLFVKNTCEKAGLEYLDTTPFFEKAGDPKQLYLFPIDAHTSSEGHRVIAKAVAKKIMQEKLLAN